MMKTDLPKEEVTSGGTKFNAARIIRETVLTLPFWKTGQDITKVSAALEIEDALDEMENNVLVVTKEAWTLLKDAMQLTGMNPIPDFTLNRLYMKIYRSVLTSSEEKPKSKNSAETKSLPE